MRTGSAQGLKRSEARGGKAEIVIVDVEVVGAVRWVKDVETVQNVAHIPVHRCMVSNTCPNTFDKGVTDQKPSM